jgi:hypothetical protein
VLSPNVVTETESKMIRWMERIAARGDVRNEYMIIFGKPQDKKNTLKT